MCSFFKQKTAYELRISDWSSDVCSRSAVCFLLTGVAVKGIVLILFGVLVIGLVDNLLRPLLVGKDTKMPDYVILISTLGGLTVFGLNGFVIGPLIAALFMACWYMFPAAIESLKD